MRTRRARIGVLCAITADGQRALGFSGGNWPKEQDVLAQTLACRDVFSGRGFGFRICALGRRWRGREYRFERARASRECAFLGRGQALDPVFGARCAGAVGEFELREHLDRFARTRIARARAARVLGEAGGNVSGDARVDAAVGAFEQVEEPRRVSGSDDRVGSGGLGGSKRGIRRRIKRRIKRGKDCARSVHACTREYGSSRSRESARRRPKRRDGRASAPSAWRWA
jgi:hypothetical protein